VTGWGTGGTLTGAGEMLKLARPDIKIIASEPETAAMLSGKPFTPHKIQGWTPDFIPAVLDREVYDEIVPWAKCSPATRRLRSRGTRASSSASRPARRSPRGSRWPERAKEGSVLLVMLPDTGERYFSTFLFEGVNEARTTSG
jgi:cysteine synthase A